MKLHNVITRTEAKALGLNKYFTGNPCGRWHLSERSVSNFNCIQCKRDNRDHAKDKAWRDANKAENSARCAVYRKKNAESIALQKKEKYAREREKILEDRKAYYEANKGAISLRQRVYAEENAEVIRERNRDYYRRNNLQRRAAGSLKRARRKLAPGEHFHDDILRILKAQKHKCACCGKSIKRNHHADHIMPLALGGSNDANNIQMLCASCNQHKSAKHPIDFMQSRGFLL